MEDFMIRNYFKIAWRKISSSKLYTLINVVGLALGICACLVIYLITSFELRYDNFHPGKDRIYRVTAAIDQGNGNKRNFGFVTVPMARTLRREISGLEKVAGFFTYYSRVTIPNEGKKPTQFEAPKFGIGASPIIIADPEYFDIFKYEWLQGSSLTALKEPFQVVLTENEAHKYFGPESLDNILGKQIIYSDSLRLTVSGIVKDWTQSTDFNFKDFISSSTIEHSFLKNSFDFDSWGMWEFAANAFVKLSNAVKPSQIESQLPAFAKKHFVSEGVEKLSLNLQPLSDIHFNSELPDSFSRKVHLPTLYGLMGIAAFILLIAAINFINLTTAQSIQRAKEIGIRKVLGSNRSKIIIQFLCETGILTFFAVCLSVLMVNPVLSAFHAFIPDGLVFRLSSPQILSFLVILTGITTLLAGLYPAKVLSSYLPVLSLKGQSAQKGNQRGLLRKSLIVFQFTVSLLFIMGTLIIGEQIHFLLTQDMGFKKDAVLVIETGYNNPPNKKDMLAQKLRSLPGVSMVSLSKETPVANGHNGTDLIYKGASEVKIESQLQIADENFIPLYGIKVIAGRNFNHSDTMNEFLLNESAARGLGFKNPEDAVGKFVESGQTDRGGSNSRLFPVVGVVADFHGQSFHEPIKPTFIASNSNASRVISIKLATQGKQIEDFKNTVAKMEGIWKEVYPNQKFEYRFFDDVIAAFYDKEQKTAQVINASMVIAIFISCMGLFGLSTFTASQRTKEIGIRKVLGASVANITTMLSKDFIGLILIAILIASPIAWYFMNDWLRGFAYRIHFSIGIFLVAGAMALLIGMLTISFHSIRSAIANPVKSLRSE
jgi:putative ABC transport system permease protein